jgi:hypothetical protein
LIELMVHTGFRISDATLFDMSRLRGNNPRAADAVESVVEFAKRAVTKPRPAPTLGGRRDCFGGQKRFSLSNASPT